MATIKEIALAAGVSQGAVSRILNDDATLSVSVATREKVLSIANDLGYKSVAQRYRMNNVSIATSNKKEINIGIAQMYSMEELREDLYYMVMKNAVDSAVFSKTWNTELIYRDDNGRFVKNSKRKLDGIIAIGRYTPEEIADLEAFTRHVVFIDSEPDDMKFHSVMPNYHMAVRIALNKFSECGFDRVAYAGAVSTVNSHRVLAIDPRFYYYQNSTMMKDNCSDDCVIDCINNNADSAYTAMSNYLEKYKKPPKAMFISSDSAAPGIVKAIIERGFNIPDDTSIITYNNTTFSTTCNPPLDSIEVYMVEYADSAVESMLKSWERRSIPKKTVIPCSLVERGSVKRAK